MAWKEYNPNPLGLHVGDCTVRAICAVTGESWYVIHRQLCDLSEMMADMPSADRVWGELLRQYGFERKRIINLCPGCYTTEDFASEHPHGVYIIGTHEHVIALIDGEWWDSWDSGKTIPTYYFRRS